MSTVKTNNLQIGQSATATNNATWYQPSTPDGTVRLGVGNAGATSSDILIANSSGNLGLGVTPSAWYAGYKAIETGSGSLVYPASATTTQLWNNLYINTAGNVTYKATGIGGLYSIGGGGNAHVWYSAPSGTAGTTATLTQAMTLDASGNLLAGTTSFSYNPINGVTLAGGSVGSVGIGHATGTTSGNGYANFTYNGTNIGSISQNGTTGVLYITSSDQRLKTNISPAGLATQSILDFPVDQFDWISDGSHVEFGAVAQKAINVIPEMVSVPADSDEMWGIDWSKAVPRLIKTIQEMHEEIQTLKAKVNA